MEVTTKKIYTAPITLGFTPFYGDLIGGTVNGVDVNGQWENDGVELYKGALSVSTYSYIERQLICSVGFLDGQYKVIVPSDSAPTTDYELHLYRYVPAGIVPIPQEFVEGLEDFLSSDQLFLSRDYPVLTPTQLSLISDVNEPISKLSMLKLSSNSAYNGASLKIDGYGIIINSSTRGSAKKFRITVDDTGTISATEVTT